MKHNRLIVVLIVHSLLYTTMLITAPTDDDQSTTPQESVATSDQCTDVTAQLTKTKAELAKVKKDKAAVDAKLKTALTAQKSAEGKLKKAQTAQKAAEDKAAKASPAATQLAALKQDITDLGLSANTLKEDIGHLKDAAPAAAELADFKSAMAEFKIYSVVDLKERLGGLEQWIKDVGEKDLVNARRKVKNILLTLDQVKTIAQDDAKQALKRIMDIQAIFAS